MAILITEGMPAGLSARASIRPRLAIRNTFAVLVLGLVLLAGGAQAGTEGASALLDLNRATADQLETLPGVGAVKAAAILAERDSRGGFQSMEELEAVRGIGPSLVAKLRPLVVIRSKKAKSGITPHE
jgi:competence ComEA-like helix-hairpin-helix protein